MEDDEFSEDPEIHAEHVTRRMSEIDLLVTTGNIRHLICDVSAAAFSVIPALIGNGFVVHCVPR